MRGLRAVIRPVIAMMVDHGHRWSIGYGDRATPVAFQAILAGNLAHLPYRDADGRLYGLDMPDGERRPVSVLAIATSIDIPYETVRARVGRLEAQRVVVRSPAGLIVPAALLNQPPLRAAQHADRDALAAVVTLLIGIGYAPPTGLTVAAIERLPATVAARLLLDFMLRALEEQPRMWGDYLNTAIVGAIVSANVRHLMADPAFAHRHADHDQPPPDALRRPIALRSLAREMGLPFETVRRRVKALAVAGDVRLSDAGVIVPTAVLVEPRFRRSNVVIAHRFRRLLHDVARLDAAPAPTL